MPASMRLLAIDTASEACAAALLDGGRLVVRSARVGRGHAEVLIGQIAAVLAEANLKPAALDRIAVTVGPGSFTGLRVGIAAARGLALATGKPAVGIPTLAVHAEAARAIVGDRSILAVIDAGRGEIYGALYASSGAEGDGAGSVAEAASAQVFAARVASGVVLAGSGADLVMAGLPMDLQPVIAHRDASPDIAALVRLAAAAPDPGRVPPRPLYLRPPDAKPQTAARIARR